MNSEETPRAPSPHCTIITKRTTPTLNHQTSTQPADKSKNKTYITTQRIHATQRLMNSEDTPRAPSPHCTTNTYTSTLNRQLLTQPATKSEIKTDIITQRIHTTQRITKNKKIPRASRSHYIPHNNTKKYFSCMASTTGQQTKASRTP